MANRSPLFRVAWQGMQFILLGLTLFGSFVAYKRIDWQSSAKRVSDAASTAKPSQASSLAVNGSSANLRDKLNKTPKLAGEMRGRPLATQATASAGLVIVKSPVAAQIFVDGKFAGKTPHSFTLPAGEHQLMLLAEGYQDWTRAILVQGNQQMGIMAALQKSGQ